MWLHIHAGIEFNLHQQKSNMWCIAKGHVITYSCWDQIQSLLAKGPPWSQCVKRFTKRLTIIVPEHTHVSITMLHCYIFIHIFFSMIIYCHILFSMPVLYHFLRIFMWYLQIKANMMTELLAYSYKNNSVAVWGLFFTSTALRNMASN